MEAGDTGMDLGAVHTLCTSRGGLTISQPRDPLLEAKHLHLIALI